jgi:hypothetical protein
MNRGAPAPPLFRRRLAATLAGSRFLWLSLLVHLAMVVSAAFIVVSAATRPRETGVFVCRAMAPPPDTTVAPTAPPAGRAGTWDAPGAGGAPGALPLAPGPIASAGLSARFQVPSPELPRPGEPAPWVRQERHGGAAVSAGAAVPPPAAKGGAMNGAEVNFFGIRARAERAVILVDASLSMLTLSKGGAEGYERVKQEVLRVVHDLPEGGAFNVILFSDRACVFGREGLVPVDAASRARVAEWLRPLHDPGKTSPATVQLAGMGRAKLLAEFEGDVYAVKDRELPPAGGTRVDIALLASFEQGPDTVFIVSDGEPQIWGADGSRQLRLWSAARVLQKIGQWKREFYAKASLKPPRVHAVGYEADAKGEAFLRSLTSQNHGTFRQVKGFKPERVAHAEVP